MSYDLLAELAEEELLLAQAGDLDALADLHLRRDVLVATLPSQAPPAARPALERAAAAHRRAAAVLAIAHAEVAAELRHISRGRAAARSYAPATTPPAPSLDRPA